jgi:hypothetical protein
MNDQPRVEPTPVVELVERYVSGELRDAEKYDNRQPLDETGVWSLHALAARIYAMGWEDGERSTARREQAARSREFDRKRAETAARSHRPDAQTAQIAEEF